MNDTKKPLNLFRVFSVFRGKALRNQLSNEN